MSNVNAPVLHCLKSVVVAVNLFWIGWGKSGM